MSVCGEISVSFNWKECRSSKFINQKLDYILTNPCRGIWNLAKTESEYMHHLSKYYPTGEQGICLVTNYTELEAIDLT